MLLFLLAAAAVPTLPICAAGNLSLAFDGENGAFDGMSHSGALLVLRNIGAHACTVPGLPRLRFTDGEGHPLPIGRRAPPGMHPGPVVVPVGIAAGAEATAPLRWVSGDVFDRGRCFAPAHAAVEIGGAVPRVAFGYRICGPATGATFDQPPLRRDPPPPPGQ